MTIGLTGGIGSGKSTIAAELAKRGYPVYDTDREAKRIIVHNPAVRSQVETLFGSDVYDGDTYLTQKVAAQVFNNPDLLHRLNNIVHPAVKFDLQHWIKSHDKPINDKIVNRQIVNLFVECAILYEAGLQTLCDKVVYVDAPEDIRIARTIARDNSNPEQVKARIHAQSDYSRRLADIILVNDGTSTISELVTHLLAQLDNGGHWEIIDTH